MTCKLSVNVNAIAYLRNRRSLPWPSVEGLGRIVLRAGAAGLTIHPRPDERHIRYSDVPVLWDLIRKEFPPASTILKVTPMSVFSNWLKPTDLTKLHSFQMIPHKAHLTMAGTFPTIIRS